MNLKHTFTLRVTTTLLVFLWSNLAALSSQISDSVSTDTTKHNPNSYFSYNLSFTNNNLTSTNIQSSKTSAFLGDFSFYHKSGFYTSIMPTLYPNASATSYDYNAFLGYQYFFSNGFDLSVYYLYHSYKGDSIYMGINYKQSANVSAGYSYGGLYAYADAYSLWGTKNNYFADAGVGYYKEFNVGKRHIDYFTLFPFISITFGTDYWAYENMTQLQLSATHITLKNSGYSWDTFDRQSVDIMLPIGYTHNNISASFSYIYSVPTNKYKLLGWENQSGLMLSLSYILNIK